MLLLLGALLATAFLDPPERFLVIGSLALIEIFEIFIWVRWRKVRSMTGREGMVGARGKAVTNCRPDGQVRVKGQIWKAHCREGAQAGEDIVVIGSQGLMLEVSPAPSTLRNRDRERVDAGYE